MSDKSSTPRSTQAPSVSPEWVTVGVIDRDSDIDVIASLFESEGIPTMVHGHNNRRMLGLLGGQIIEVRLWVPRAHQADGEALFARYFELQREALSEEERAERDEMNGPDSKLTFSDTKQRAAFSLLAALFVGFGLASWVAGAWWFTIIAAPLQALRYWPEIAQTCADGLGMNVQDLMRVSNFVPIADLTVAFLTLFGSTWLGWIKSRLS